MAEGWIEVDEPNDGFGGFAKTFLVLRSTDEEGNDVVLLVQGKFTPAIVFA